MTDDRIRRIRRELDRERLVVQVYQTVLARHAGCPRDVEANRRVRELERALGVENGERHEHGGHGDEK